MVHRHLNHQELTLAAIDDVISRGKRKEWEELRQAALTNPLLWRKIQQVCRAHIGDPRAQRYHFWMHYAEEKSLPEWETDEGLANANDSIPYRAGHWRRRDGLEVT